MKDPVSAPRLGKIDWKVIAGLSLAFTIAWITPFDRVFGAATMGVPILRGAGICALAIIGAKVGQRIGLSVAFQGSGRPILFTLGVTALVAVGCAAIDWLFRPVLSPDYVALMDTPVVPRTAAFMARAFNENIMYRLFLGSVLAWAIGRVWRREDGLPADGAYWVGFAVAQLLNVWMNVTSRSPANAITLVHDVLRYVVPGLVWAWLYWRRGFQSNEIACTSVHILLQPMLQLLI